MNQNVRSLSADDKLVYRLHMSRELNRRLGSWWGEKLFDESTTRLIWLTHLWVCPDSWCSCLSRADDPAVDWWWLLVCIPPGESGRPWLDWMRIVIEGFLFYAECVRDLKCCLIKLLFVGCIDYTQPSLVSLPFPHHYFCDQQGSRWLGSWGANVIFLVRRLVLLRQPFIISASYIDHNNSCKTQGAFQTVPMPLLD